MTDTSQHDNMPRATRNASRPLKRAAKRIAIALLAVMVIGGGGFLYYYTTSQTFKDAVDIIATKSYEPEVVFPEQDSINLLLMGRDEDRDERGRVVNTRGRSDAMMLVHVDFDSRSVNLLSIPRDTLVKVPGYRGQRRISYAHALGGPELAIDTVAEFFGVKPDYFLVMDYDGFESAIDVIGGVEVDVDKQMEYDDHWGNLHIHLEPGRQILDGNQALGFVRYRQSNDGDMESDFDRISRQQELLGAVGDRLSDPRIMFKVPKVMDIIRDETDGNFTTSQMVCLARFLMSLSLHSDIRMETLPSREGGGIYVRADRDATDELVRQMFFDNQP